MADRTITIEKRGAPGYGFSIVGGAPSPVMISKITPGTPAAGCPDLVVGDQILSIDGLDLHGQNNFQVDMAKVLASPADKERRMKEEAEHKDKERLAAHAAVKASSPAVARKDAPEEVVSPRKAGVPPPVRTAAPVVPRPAVPAPAAAATRAPVPAPAPAAAPKPAVASPPKPAVAAAVAPAAAPVPARAPAPAATPAPVAAPAPAPAPAASASPAVDPQVAVAFGNVIARLENVLGALEAKFGAAAVGELRAALAGEPEGASVPPSVEDYENLLNGTVAKLVTLGQTLGGDVAEISKLASAAFQSQLEMMRVVPLTQKPGDKVLGQLLEASSAGIAAVQKFKDDQRKTTFPNHLSAISDSMTALSWVTVLPAPASFVKEMNDCSIFYVNRIIKDFSGQAAHVEWARAITAVFDELAAFVKKHHTTGLAWGKKIRGAAWWANALAATAPGTSAPDKYKFSTLLNQPVVSEPGEGVLPEAEVLKPQRPLNPIAKSALMSRPDIAGGVLSAIGVGDAVVSGPGLRHVSKDEMTHKNPALRGSSVVPASASTAPAERAPAAAAAPAAKPPVFELQGKKWAVENQKGATDLVIEGDAKHTVYIYKCTATTVQIKGKVNSVVCDGCTKTAVVCDSVIASLEFVNCKSMQLQVMGKVNIVSIDKTDGCQVYLSAESAQAQIVSAKSSEMNVLVPGEDGEFLEMPMPEQYKTVWNGSKFVTTVNDMNL